MKQKLNLDIHNKENKISTNAKGLQVFKIKLCLWIVMKNSFLDNLQIAQVTILVLPKKQENKLFHL